MIKCLSKLVSKGKDLLFKEKRKFKEHLDSKSLLKHITGLNETEIAIINSKGVVLRRTTSEIVRNLIEYHKNIEADYFEQEKGAEIITYLVLQDDENPDFLIRGQISQNISLTYDKIMPASEWLYHRHNQPMKYLFD